MDEGEPHRSGWRHNDRQQQWELWYGFQPVVTVADEYLVGVPDEAWDDRPVPVDAVWFGDSPPGTTTMAMAPGLLTMFKRKFGVSLPPEARALARQQRG